MAPDDNPLMTGKIKPIPFGRRPGREPYNASEVVAIGDSRFLFCDNNVSDALFEFRVTVTDADAQTSPFASVVITSLGTQ